MSVLIYFATIFWALFPNLVHVFQGGNNFINKVNATNLVSNSDLLTAKPNNQNEPLGFYYTNATDISLTNGIAKFTATARFGNIQRSSPATIFNESDTFYSYARVKTLSKKVSLPFSDNFDGLGEWEVRSQIIKETSNLYTICQVTDYSTEDFKEIEVDYLGAYNVSEMIFNGVKNDNEILFSDLTETEIKTQLDIWVNEHGDLSYIITKDNTSNQWFNTGFVDKVAERDFLDYLGYFAWLLTPPITLFAILKLLRRII